MNSSSGRICGRWQADGDVKIISVRFPHVICVHYRGHDVGI